MSVDMDSIRKEEEKGRDSGPSSARLPESTTVDHGDGEREGEGYGREKNSLRSETPDQAKCPRRWR